MSDINGTTAIALAEMKACRKAVIDLGAAYGHHSGQNRQATHLIKLIDGMAELLTGDWNYFRDPHHSTP